MIKEFVEIYDKKRDALRAKLSEKHPDSYRQLINTVICCLFDDLDSYDLDCGVPDSDRIHEINDGDYQGTLLYLIADKGYQPDVYWYVKISYGSCSVCDTLQSIREIEYEDIPTEEQTNQYFTLATHIVQQLKRLE